MCCLRRGRAGNGRDHFAPEVSPGLVDFEQECTLSSSSEPSTSQWAYLYASRIGRPIYRGTDDVGGRRRNRPWQPTGTK